MTGVAVTPTVGFVGYPDGERVRFEPGVRVMVSEDYARMLARKGLVERLPKKAPDGGPKDRKR